MNDWWMKAREARSNCVLGQSLSEVWRDCEKSACGFLGWYEYKMMNKLLI
jgi:hypothetical protein